jgi:hypothetical protein
MICLMDEPKTLVSAPSQMKYHKLRIAWSVASGVATVLLIALWVQDYRNTRLIASVPYAFPILVAFAFAAAPFANGKAFVRFSLRTLLIVATVVCVGLGLIEWAAK